MSKKIYVGGCFDDYLEIRKIQNILILKGYEISYDWTIRAEKTVYERNNLSVDIRTADKLKEEAELDMNGIYEADWTIFIITRKEYVYRGTFFELGASIMRDTLRNKRQTIILSNKNENTYAKTLCFFHHPSIIHVNTIDDAINEHLCPQIPQVHSYCD